MARLTIPLDASGIEGFDPKQPVKVLLTSGGTPVASETITFDKKGLGQVGFDVDPKQTGLRVVLGPPDASDEELTGLQTIGVDVPRRRFGGRDGLVIPAIRMDASSAPTGRRFPAPSSARMTWTRGGGGGASSRSDARRPTPRALSRSPSAGAAAGGRGGGCACVAGTSSPGSPT